MGNWPFKTGNKPYLHVHVLGRAKDAKIQVFPESVQLPDRGTGFYDDFKPLNEADYEEAEKIAHQRKVPLGDVLHAIVARNNGAILISQDKHHQQLKDIVQVKKPEEII